MIFFREIIKLLQDGETISLAITRKDSTGLSISFASVRPAVLNGTMDELDEEFLKELSLSRVTLPAKDKLKSRVDKVAKSDDDKSEKAPSKEATKTKSTVKDSSKKKDDDKANPPVPEKNKQVTDPYAKDINDGIAQAAEFTDDLKFINAIDLLNKLDKKYPKNAAIEAALFATRTAKAKHEFDADDEDVKVPAATSKKSANITARMSEETDVPHEKVAEEEEPEVVFEEPEEETVTINATDEEDDF